MRSDFKEKIDRVAIELVRTRAEMATKADMADIKNHLNTITKTLDTLSGEVVDNRRTLLSFDQILREHRETLASHETRLTVLESRN